MADLSITPANVVASSTALKGRGTAGATITAGQQLYYDSASDSWKLADSDSATAAVRSPRGTALHAASSGQPIAFVTEGPVTIGATLTAGLAYYLSKTAGGICPVADIASGGYATIIGIATSTSILDIKYHESGVAV